MHTGQTMLTIGALVLLSLFGISYYASMGRQGELMSQSQAGLVATSLAASYKERILNCYFDESAKTNNFRQILDNPSLLSTTLGRDAGETSVDLYDDVDDFNGDTVTTTLSNGTYSATFSVYYVTPNNIDQPSSSPTFLKRVDIRVWRSSPPIDKERGAIVEAVTMSCVRGFFKYNENF